MLGDKLKYIQFTALALKITTHFYTLYQRKIEFSRIRLQKRSLMHGYWQQLDPMYIGKNKWLGYQQAVKIYEEKSENLEKDKAGERKWGEETKEIVISFRLFCRLLPQLVQVYAIEQLGDVEMPTCPSSAWNITKVKTVTRQHFRINLFLIS